MPVVAVVGKLIHEEREVVASELPLERLGSLLAAPLSAGGGEVVMRVTDGEDVAGAATRPRRPSGPTQTVGQRLIRARRSDDSRRW